MRGGRWIGGQWLIGGGKLVGWDTAAPRVARNLDATLHTFVVRFDSRDDFLVEYADRIRHGFLLLPIEGRLEMGAAVRLRLHLPDEQLIVLAGVATGRPSEAPVMEGQWIRLSPLLPGTDARLVASVAGMLSDDSLVGGSGGVRQSSTAEGEPLSVLLVDDSATHRLELGEALRARSQRVVVAENGLVALSSALKAVPDVILTDVEMAQMDGWGLLRAVRQRPSLGRVAVVFLTRLSDEGTRLRGYRLGVDDYLPKQLPTGEILARMQGAVIRRKQLPVSQAPHTLRGALEHVRLASLLTFLETELRSGSLHLRRSGETYTATIHRGTLRAISDHVDAVATRERMFDLLAWTHGEFEFVAHGTDEDTPPPGPVGAGLSTLVREHIRRQAERDSNEVGVVKIEIKAPR